MEDRVATIFELVESMRNPHKILNALGVASDKVYRAAPSECIAVSYTHLTLPTTPYV